MADNNHKKLLTLFVILAIVVGIVAGTVSFQKKQKLVEQNQNVYEEQNLNENADTSTSLYFLPTEQIAYPGELITVTAYMNTGTSLVNGVDIKTVYDPKVFEVLEFTKDTNMQGFSQEIKNNIDNKLGVFRYSAFNLDIASFLNGMNLPVYTLKVKVNEDVQAGTYAFDFDPSTVISASDAGQNVFISSSPHAITILEKDLGTD